MPVGNGAMSFFETFLDRYAVLHDWPALKALAIVFAYVILAKVADLLIDRVLRRLARLTKVRSDDRLIDFLHAPVCWTVVLVGGLHALVVLQLPPPWGTVAPSLLKSLILLVWWVAFIRVVNWFTDKRLSEVVTQGDFGRDLFYMLKNVLRVVVVILGALWLLAIWDINLTPLFASAGIAGIAVALAAKDTLANFFGGISVYVDRSYKVGDYIILDSGERGEVTDVGIRSTRVKTRDDVLITIPNSIMANSKIINESAPIPRFRIRIPVGVAYGSDIGRVEETMLAVALANSRVVRELEPRVRLRAFGASSVDFELLCWVEDPSMKGLAIHEILGSIYNAFEEKGITIPFPQQDVHLDVRGGKSPEGPGGPVVSGIATG
jgi:MscS family membrane protein